MRFLCFDGNEGESVELYRKRKTLEFCPEISPITVFGNEKREEKNKNVSVIREKEEGRGRDHINFVSCNIVFFFFLITMQTRKGANPFVFPLVFTVILSLFRGYLGDLFL